MQERQKSFWDRLVNYKLSYGERFLGIDRHGKLHLRGRGGIWYVFPYKKIGDARKSDDADSRRVLLFWHFMEGDKTQYPYFYLVFLRAIRQLLWVTKVIGDFELAVVPRSSPGGRNPIAEVCSAIAREERFILSKPSDGTDLIVRVKKMTPVHLGGKYSVRDIEESLQITRPLKAKTILLVEDMVFSGRTIAACKRRLKDAGARKVYAVCLYGYKRKDTWQREQR